MQRRWNNPYFKLERRSVTPVELENAQLADAKDYEEGRRSYIELFEAVSRLPEVSASATIINLWTKTDDLLKTLMGIGGPALHLAHNAEQLREKLIHALRRGMTHDAGASERLERAVHAQDEGGRKFLIPFIAQLLRKDSPIPGDEVVAAVLTEEPATISIFFDLQDENGKEIMKKAALQITGGAAFDGFSDPLLSEKFRALGIVPKK